MKFSQLKEYNMRNIFFLENHTKNVVEKLVPDPFTNSQNWAYLSINSLKYYNVCFYLCPSRSLPKYIKIKVLTTCFYFNIKLFWKTKRGLNLVCLSNFLYDFWRKRILALYSINWPKLIAWLPLLFEISGNKCIINNCCPTCDVINFEFNFNFLIKPTWLNGQGKSLNILRTKRAFNTKQAFFIILKCFQLSEIASDLQMDL